MAKFMFVGLGNIGAEYAHTRHNIGFDVVTAFAHKHGGIFRVDRLAEVAQVSVKGKQVLLVKPTTYMNLSGKAYKYWLDKEKISIENTITVVDDLALPIETLRLRGTGSDAGHNGLKDIQLTIGTQAYPKLRFGIGSNFAKGQQVPFVLGKFNTTEQPIVDQKINTSIEILETFIHLGLEKTMNLFNQKK